MDEIPLGNKKFVFRKIYSLGLLILVVIMVNLELEPIKSRAYFGQNEFEDLKKESKIFRENSKFNFFSAEQVNQKKGFFQQNKKLAEFEKKLYALIGDYPIKEMVPFIAEKDERVAAFIVGIAKKESDWGKHVPTQNGKDCYNYWGYKGVGQNGKAMGYGCFATPAEAVNAIGGRLTQLVEKNLTTPSKMVVWKCGSSCAGHSPEGVQKWVSDVSVYFNRILQIKKEV